MRSFSWIIAAFVLSLCHIWVQGQDVCPEACPDETYVYPNCRKAEFTIGFDGQTRCPKCDSNLCGKKLVVCPQLTCPNDANITQECRRRNFVIGSDNITRCRVCDSSVCGDPKVVCPKITCPGKPPISTNKILTKCWIKQFVIGTDGITMCPACDKNICQGKQVY